MAAEAAAKFGAKALVTGCNRGIGLEIARQLVDAGTQVYAAVRKSSEELDKIGVTKVITGVDMSSDEAIARMAADLAENEVKLDLVINNSGMLLRENWETLNPDGILQQFNVNAVGPMRVVKAVEGLFTDSAKIANITSLMGSIADVGSDAIPGYRMSKTALNMATVVMKFAFAKRNIPVCCIHPGHVQTDMGGERAKLTPQDSAAGILERVAGLNMDNSGKFWNYDGREFEW